MAKRLADKAIMGETSSSSDFSDLDHYKSKDSANEHIDFKDKKFDFFDEVTSDL
jgi:hypothetical protein